LIAARASEGPPNLADGSAGQWALDRAIRRHVMLLKDKIAVIYGAGGSIGGAVARAFAADGARLFLAGRTLRKIESLAAEIAAAGGLVAAAEVDALDEAAVEGHVSDVVGHAGRIDVLFNAIGMDDVQGSPITDMPVDDFIRPVVKAARTQFLTARAVARQMAKQGSGVILTLTAGPPEAISFIGGFGSACGAVEHLWRVLAAELGPKGVRVICLRSAGSPDTPDVQETFRRHAAASGITAEQFLADMGSDALMKRLPLMVEVANAATLMASDRASAVTGSFLHVTCGSRIE
jgi:3-oxoacyl-[acyl-carrier protein] reductase